MVDRPVSVTLSARDQLTPSLTQAAAAADRLTRAATQASAATARIGQTRTGATVGAELTQATAAAGRYATATRQAATASTAMGAAAARSAAGMASVGRAADTAAKSHRSVADTAAAMGMSFGGIISPLTAVAAGLVGSVKAAIDWDSAWTGVKKTVDGVDFGVLEGQLRDMATSLPQTHQEIAAVAEAAGQLGVAGTDIAGFSRVMLDMGQATNLSSDQAATSMARISNVMGTMAREGVTGISRMGATIVALGNTTASTEAEITSMATRLAGAAATVGMSESAMLGLAASMSSVGIEAELGGSAMSRAMLGINSAVIEGGAKLEQFSDIAGVTAEEFAAAWREDPGQAMQMFLQGLNGVVASGGDVAEALKQVGLRGTENASVFSRLANATDTVTAANKTAGEAWAANSALADEAAKRYESAGSQIKIAWNQVKDTLITVGAAMAPMVGTAASLFGGMAEAAGNVPGPILAIAAALLAMNVAGRSMPDLGPRFAGMASSVDNYRAVLLATRHGMTDLANHARTTGASLENITGRVAGSVPVMGTFSAAMQVAGGSMGVLRTAGSSLLSFLGGPWGVAFAAAGVALAIFGQRSAEARARQQELESAVSQVASAVAASGGQWSTQAQQQFIALQSTQQLIASYGQLGYSTETVTQALIGEGEARTTILAQMDARIDAVTREGIAISAASGLATNANQTEINSWQAKRDALAEAIGAAEQAIGSGQQQAAASEAVAAANEGVASSAREGAAGLGELGNQAGLSAKQMSELVSAITNVGGALLGQRDAARGFEAAIDAATSALEKNGATLDITTEKGRANEAALDAIASTGARAAAELLNTGGSMEEVGAQIDRARAAFINAATGMGMSSSAAAALADQLGLTSGNVQALADAMTQVPGSVNTQVNVNGLPEASAGLEGLVATAALVPATVAAQVAVLGAAAANGELLGVVASAQQVEAQAPNVEVSESGAAATQAQLNRTTETAQTTGAQRPNVVVTETGNPVVQLALAATTAAAKITAAQRPNVAVSESGAAATQGKLGATTAKAQELGRQRPNAHVTVSGTETAISAVGRVLSTLRSFAGQVFTAFARVVTQQADGGFYPEITAYANGGTRRENHVAQIAPAGAWRVWAEEETGGEAYIPLAKSKRSRSMAILSQVAEEFGYALVRQAQGAVMSFAGGGGYRQTTSASLRPNPLTAATIPVDVVVTSVTMPKDVTVYTPGGTWDRSSSLPQVATSAIQKRYDELTAVDEKTKKAKFGQNASTFLLATNLTAQYSRQFLRNIETIAARGYPDIAARLLEMGEDQGAKPAASFATANVKVLNQQRAAFNESAKMAQLAADLQTRYNQQTGPAAWVTASKEAQAKSAVSRQFLTDVSHIADYGYLDLAFRLLDMGEEAGGDLARQAAAMGNSQQTRTLSYRLTTEAREIEALRRQAEASITWRNAAHTQRAANVVSEKFLSDIRAIRQRGYPDLALRFLEMGEDQAGALAAEAAKGTDTALAGVSAANKRADDLKTEADKLLADLKGVGQVLTVLSIAPGQGTSTTPSWSARPLPRSLPTPYQGAGQWTPPGRSGPLVNVEKIETADPARVGNDLITHVGDAVAVTGLDRLVL